MAEMEYVSIIIPVLDETKALTQLLKSIQPWRDQGHEIILVDGGSEFKHRSSISHLVDKNLNSGRGRALQMNHGANHAQHEILFFLHADSTVTENSLDAIRQGLKINNSVWGRFDIALSGSLWMFRIIETMMNVRSRLTGIATGDQGLFVKREVFNRLNRYAEIE